MANLFKRLFGAQAPQQAKASPRDPGFRFIGGGLVPYDKDKLTYIEKGYMMNEMVYSVVKLIVDKAKIAPMAAYKVVDEQKYFEYQRLRKMQSSGAPLSGKEFHQMREAKYKSLKRDTSDGYLNQLLETPTEDVTMDELNEALMTFLLVTGDYFEGGWNTWSGGLNAGKPVGQFELPSQWMWINAGKSIPMKDVGYELTIGGRLSYTKEEVLHSKTFNPVWNTAGSQLYGMSPLEAFSVGLQAANLGKRRQARIMDNAGADAIVYLDDPETVRQYQDWSIEQIGLMKERFDSEQGGFLNAGKAVWSPNKVGVARLGMTMEELGQLPAEVQNMRAVCNLYNVPSQLMNDPENKTFANQEEGQKALLYNAVLPLHYKRQKAYTMKLRKCPAYANGATVVEFDNSVYKELEADKKELVEWLDKSFFDMQTRYQYLDQEIPASMPKEVREAIVIPSGYQLLNDLFIPADDLSGTIDALGDENPYLDTPVS